MSYLLQIYYIYIFLHVLVGAKDLSPSVGAYCIYAMIYDTKINDLQQWKTTKSKMHTEMQHFYEISSFNILPRKIQDFGCS